ncbi:hypothetical protein [uncultured Megasphaera sp.]|uniref:hypothetical protein n=1 Tax=uncultured Megasphaera sp. TaxID=165188 RepID=UPI00260DB0C0|nr:hypothetical protein [uncultured Megasphaera sp.]
MKHSQRDTVHRVRAVRSWLEKAEASFDEESDIKGELNLMLAEAEMKNLRKHHPVSKGWLRAGALVTAFCLALGGWYGIRLTGQEERPSAVEAVVHETAAGNEAGKDSADKAVPVSNPVPAEEVQSPVQERSVPTAESAPSTVPARDEPVVQPAATAAAAPEPTVPAPALTERKAVLSDRQVQATVQEARHTLRGTGITK